jgi:hypothetical protein
MICPSCGKGCASPKLSNKPYLIIKEQITQAELDADTVFVQKGKNKWGYEQNTTSYYLNKELGMVGLMLSQFNLTNLYMHQLPKSKRTKEDKAILQGCIDFSIAEVLKLAEGKKIILLMGAGVIKTFTEYNASEVYGLSVKSEYFPNVPVLIPAPNPDKIMSQPIGELRISLKSLADHIKTYEAYQKV